MNPPPASPPPRVTGFRAKLVVAMMLVVGAITALALYFAEHNLAGAAEGDLEREFQAELTALHQLHEIRHAALLERCHALVRKARIHAALEDGALDLLYPSAEDELRDVMTDPARLAPAQGTLGLHAKFYRFLDRHGAVIPPPNTHAVGALPPATEARLALPGLSETPQLGYLADVDDTGSPVVTETIAMPIVSGETGEVIAALVLGFRPAPLGGARAGGIRRGLWLNGRIYLSTLERTAESALGDEVARALAATSQAAGSLRVQVGGAPHLLFYKQLNPGSLFPAALEVCIYPLADLFARQRAMRWQVLGAGALLLLGGFGASHVLAGRFSAPVEKLAVTSAENFAQRTRAETALETTNAELQRAARFSADASHQLKTPVTVLRAGLEELLTRENLTPSECTEISALIHQTYRLSGVIEDLLLLSRLDAGRLKLDLKPVNLTHLIEASVDDLSALPDSASLAVETDFPPDVHIAGERRYTALILQNLLENAHKYNRPGGRIRLAVRLENNDVVFSVGNTGRAIPPAAQAHIFERFHRGALGENIPGYGLGLNLAREIARLHNGDLVLTRSDDTWTEFTARFHAMPPAA